MSLDIRLDTLAERLNADPEFRHRARFWSAVVRLGDPQPRFEVHLRDGQVVDVTDPGDGEATIVLSGPPEGWERMLGRVPVPFHHDLLYAATVGFTLDASEPRDLFTYYGALQRLVSLLGAERAGAAEVAHETPFRDSDIAVGRYVYVAVDGIEHRVYYEEAGAGIPLLLQHTAGADSRQWRHVLADPWMQERFRMVAYDLPYHGRSLPPSSDFRWWEHEHSISKDQLIDQVVAISRGIGLDRPVFMGCSIGGQLATDLAADRPKEIRAAVAINAWLHQEPLTKGAQWSQDYLAHPRVASEGYASMAFGCTSPTAPEVLRRETYWIYASNAPGIYKADNHYFLFDHDLRENGGRIDTKATPLYLVTGAYDLSLAFPDASAEAIAAMVPGAKFTILEGLGHFAPFEDPARFSVLMRPVLDDVLEVSA